MLYQTCKHVLVMILYTLQVILECLIMYQNGHFVEFVLMAVCSGSGFCRNTADVFKAEWERSGYGKTDVLFFCLCIYVVCKFYNMVHHLLCCGEIHTRIAGRCYATNRTGFCGIWNWYGRKVEKRNAC